MRLTDHVYSPKHSAVARRDVYHCHCVEDRCEPLVRRTYSKGIQATCPALAGARGACSDSGLDVSSRPNSTLRSLGRGIIRVSDSLACDLLEPVRRIATHRLRPL